MEPIPQDFLGNVATEYHLSEEQREAFLERYSNPDKSQETVAETLHITPNAFRTRMSGVYKKFSIGGKGPNKSRKLHDFLWKKYKQSNFPVNEDKDKNLDVLVQEVRDKVGKHIKQRCGTMRVLDMTQAIKLGEIYTNVNILEKITATRRLELAQLQESLNQEENLDRCGLFGIAEQRVPGLEVVKQYSKLMIWGKPGSGKTTFLKYLAMESIGGKFPENRVPIFIPLKDFAEIEHQPNLLTFIQQFLTHYQVSETEITSLLAGGRLLILLDGLDEVRQKDSHGVIQQIQSLADFYSNNCFVITCRIAAKEYTFEGFTEVEVADFDKQQVETFANKWFQLQDEKKGELFLKKLKQEENKPILELASNPLLLTLLCLVFGETANFPQNRSELYKEGIDVLLKKWDGKRNIERDLVYQRLSLKRKEDLLSQIAWTTFEAGDYFFKQRRVERYIGDYIYNLPDGKTDPEALQLDSEAILKSIESQHGLLVERAKGIYSFSHLTFQEYFAARKIASISEPQKLEQGLRSLVSRLTETRWREVFFLVVEMLDSADFFFKLMKEKIEPIIAKDDKLQEFLTWCMKNCYFGLTIKEKILQLSFLSVPNQLEPIGVGMSFSDGEIISQSYTVKGWSKITKNINYKSEIDINFIFYCWLSFLSINDFSPIIDFKMFNNSLLENNLDHGQKQWLKHLNEKLPELDELDELDEELSKFTEWWQLNGKTWLEELRMGMIKYRNIGHDWQFNDQQQELLWQYYNANMLLVDCLNKDCYVSRQVRKEVENTILLPIAEIEKRKSKS